MRVRSITRFMYVLAIVALIAGFPACDSALNEFVSVLSGDDTPQLTRLSGEIPIGVVLALTGQFDSAVGIPMQQGFELAREEINNAQLGNARLTFITEDTRSESAVEAFNKLIDEDGVPIIIGLAISTQAAKAFPIAQENQVVAFSPLSAASGLSALGDFIFRASLTTDMLISRGVEATQEKLGYKKVATIYDASDLYSRSSNAAAQTALTAKGIEVLTMEAFLSGETDFSEQLTKIKALNPDAIFISVLPLKIPQVMIQARQLGIPTSVPFITPQLSIEQVRAAGPVAEGVITFISWSSVSPTPGNQTFVQSYSDKYGIEPNAWAAQSYAALYILAKAMAKAGSTDSTAIRDALATIMDLPTILGQFSFDPDGDAIYDPKILVVKDGQFEVFE